MMLCTEQTTSLYQCGQGRMIRCLRFGTGFGLEPQWLFDARCLEMDRSHGVLGSLEKFLSEGDAGDTATIKIIEMLEYDYERLREI